MPHTMSGGNPFASAMAGVDLRRAQVGKARPSVPHKRLPPAPVSPSVVPGGDSPTLDTTRTAHAPVNRKTVSGRQPYRSNEIPYAPPNTVPPIPMRREWQPLKRAQAKTVLDLNKMKNLMRNALGHDARINENNSMYVPVATLPNDLKGANPNVVSTKYR